MLGSIVYIGSVGRLVKKNRYIAMEIYDWLLSQSIVFKDKKYKNREGFFLAQKLPDNLISSAR